MSVKDNDAKAKNEELRSDIAKNIGPLADILVNLGKGADGKNYIKRTMPNGIFIIMEDPSSPPPDAGKPAGNGTRGPSSKAGKPAGKGQEFIGITVLKNNKIKVEMGGQFIEMKDAGPREGALVNKREVYPDAKTAAQRLKEWVATVASPEVNKEFKKKAEMQVQAPKKEAGIHVQAKVAPLKNAGNKPRKDTLKR